MKELLIIIACVLLVIYIMFYIGVEAYFKGWRDCFEEIKEIDERYIKSMHAYINGLEEQVKAYQNYVEILCRDKEEF